MLLRLPVATGSAAGRDRQTQALRRQEAHFAKNIFALRAILKGPPFYLKFVQNWGLLRGEEAHFPETVEPEVCVCLQL